MPTLGRKQWDTDSFPCIYLQLKENVPDKPMCPGVMARVSLTITQVSLLCLTLWEFSGLAGLCLHRVFSGNWLEDASL